MDVAPVHGDTLLRRERLRDVRRGDRSEQLALLASPRRDHDGGLDDAGGDRLELALLRVRPRPMSPREALGVTHGPLLGAHGEAARDQEVAGVAVGDIRDIAGVTQALDRLLQDDLHAFLGATLAPLAA